MSFGRPLSPSFTMPRAIAPLDTMTTDVSARRSRSDATSVASRSQASPVRLFEPILMTMRRAARSPARARTSLLGGSRASSAIVETRSFTYDFVERRLQTTLEIARECRAREQEGVDPAGELVAQILQAPRDRGE